MTILIAVGVRIARFRIRLTQAEQSRLSFARQIEQRPRCSGLRFKVVKVTNTQKRINRGCRHQIEK